MRYALLVFLLFNILGCEEKHEVKLRVQTLNRDACEATVPLELWPQKRHCALIRLRDDQGNPVGLKIANDDTLYGTVVLPKTTTSNSSLLVNLPEDQSRTVQAELRVYDTEGNILATGMSPHRPLCSDCTIGITLTQPGQFSCTGASIRGEGPTPLIATNGTIPMPNRFPRCRASACMAGN